MVTLVMDCPRRDTSQQIITNPNLPEGIMPDQVQDTTMKTGTGKIDPDHNLIFADIVAGVIVIHTEATSGLNIKIIIATIVVAYDTCTPLIEVTAIDLIVTHHINHITDAPHIEVLQLTTPEITADHAHNHPTNLQGETDTDQVHIATDHEANHTSRRTQG